MHGCVNNDCGYTRTVCSSRGKCLRALAFPLLYFVSMARPGESVGCSAECLARVLLGFAAAHAWPRLPVIRVIYLPPVCWTAAGFVCDIYGLISVRVWHPVVYGVGPDAWLRAQCVCGFACTSCLSRSNMIACVGWSPHGRSVCYHRCAFGLHQETPGSTHVEHAGVR
jgi:hypothetical protein